MLFWILRRYVRFLTIAYFVVATNRNWLNKGSAVELVLFVALPKVQRPYFKNVLNYFVLHEQVSFVMRSKFCVDAYKIERNGRRRDIWDLSDNFIWYAVIGIATGNIKRRNCRWSDGNCFCLFVRWTVFHCKT